MTLRTANVAGDIRGGSRLPVRRPAVGGFTDQKRGCALPLRHNAKMDKFRKHNGFEKNPQFEPAVITGGIHGEPAHRTEAIDSALNCNAKATTSDFTDVESANGNLNAVLDHECARNTIANYSAQWRNFIIWALVRGVPEIPAEPAHVAEYLAERIEKQGHKPATLRMAAAAIAFVHKAAGVDSPCASPDVKRLLKGATRKAGRSQKQAGALTAEALAVIELTARNPRRGRGGKLESQEAAKRRGNLDIALIYVMRDAMLRVSEAASMDWSDIESEADGTGRLLIRRSKTDAEGEGAVAFLSASTMVALGLIRSGTLATGRVFGLRPNQISRRIEKAAQAAGLGDDFSGHSPRVGMARDLARAGIELPSLMTAGRWRSPSMPAHYIRNEIAGRGAVAQFYVHHLPS